MKRQALGKGLSSLIPETPAARPEAGLLMLDVDRIQPSQYQPRSDFTGLEGLVESIRENGIVQPVVVRQEGERFELIAGERRWRAAQLAGMMRIPAVVRKVGQEQVLELALIENIQRKDLNPIEEAKAYDLLIVQMKMSQADIAKRVGRERSSVANSLRLLKLPEKIQSMVTAGTLTQGHAKAIVAISDAGTQIKVADEVVRKNLSVRETEALAARLTAERTAGAKAADGSMRAVAIADAEDPNVRAAQENLQRHLGTKVRIVRKGGRGRIEVEFYSEEELDRLYTTMMLGH
ncbi:MAG TPA: ParB/RepB/Spo0J family partition protein [Candidatus Polarisedimenticolia bacterium]|jgi:ParB family chromosome partitioning protein|nr:ParB/RepB/Spo0J family partition protein [Candidatus Polarisedimenticolia bacterium]